MTSVHRSELTPLTFLRRSALAFPDRAAVVHRARRTTYSELEQRALRLASALRSAGLEPGDRVAVLCPNVPAMLEAHFAVPAAGGVLVPLNVRLSASEIAYILGHSGARHAIVDRELGHLVEGAAGVHVVRSDDTGAPDDPYEALIASGDPAFEPILPADEDEPLSINYTSGTTGRPKGVVATHRGSYLNALAVAIETGLGLGSVYLWVLPMFHCNGWCHTWGVTAVGGTHVCLRKVQPAAIWELLEAERVTHACGAPTVYIDLAAHEAARPLSRGVTVSMGGAPPSPTLLARLEELGFRPRHLYGLTETYGPITVCAWNPAWDALPAGERARLAARQGVALLAHDPVRVVDERLRDVPADGETIGEIVMRGNTVMRGYHRDEEASARAFAGGWFHSGDLAVRHPDGYVELRDRVKDIIISGGENISTIEVEQVIVSHPAVLECAVVAMPDDRWGERPKAFVATRPGVELDEADLIAFCRERLAHFKCPAAVEFGELPKTSTGKIRKYVLRERARS